MLGVKKISRLTDYLLKVFSVFFFLMIYVSVLFTFELMRGRFNWVYEVSTLLSLAVLAYLVRMSRQDSIYVPSLLFVVAMVFMRPSLDEFIGFSISRLMSAYFLVVALYLVCVFSYGVLFSMGLKRQVAVSASSILGVCITCFVLLDYFVNIFLYGRISGFLTPGLLRIGLADGRYSLFIINSQGFLYLPLFLCFIVSVAVLSKVVYGRISDSLTGWSGGALESKSMVAYALVFSVMLVFTQYGSLLVSGEPVLFFTSHLFKEALRGGVLEASSIIVPPKFDSQKNILLLIVESLRADHLPSYGYGRNTTPYLQRRMGNAIRLENFYVPSPNSYDALYSVITGRYPCRMRVGQTNVFDVMKYNGYRTSVFSSHSKKLLGMDEIVYNRNIDYHFEPGDRLDSRVELTKVESMPIYPDSEIIKRISAWVAQSDQKFYVEFFMQATHIPYQVNENMTPFLPYKGLDRPLYSMLVSSLTERDRQLIVNRYDDSIVYVDYLIQSLLADLESKGVLNDTIVIIIGDHGEAFGEHGAFSHGHNIFDEQVRVPFIILNPPQETSFASSYGQQTDILPTVISLLGVEGFKGFDGVDLLSEDRGWVYFCSERKNGLLVDGKKYVVDTTTGREELFDTVEDRDELKDISNSHGSELDRLRQRFLVLDGKYS